MLHKFNRKALKLYFLQHLLVALNLHIRCTRIHNRRRIYHITL